MYKNTGRDTGDADPAREMVSKWFILGKNDSFRDTGDADPARELVSNWFILGQNNVKTTFLVKKHKRQTRDPGAAAQCKNCGRLLTNTQTHKHTNKQRSCSDSSPT